MPAFDPKRTSPFRRACPSRYDALSLVFGAADETARVYHLDRRWGCLAVYSECATIGQIWRIGFLAGGAGPTSFEGTAYGAFLRGMRELGYAENRDYIVEWRFAEGRLELLPTLAEELVRSNVDVIVTGLTAAIPVAQRATTTIPIVMTVSVDLVGNGYVASLANPTGNITGLSFH